MSKSFPRLAELEALARTSAEAAARLKARRDERVSLLTSGIDQLERLRSTARVVGAVDLQEEIASQVALARRKLELIEAAANTALADPGEGIHAPAPVEAAAPAPVEAAAPAEAAPAIEAPEAPETVHAAGAVPETGVLPDVESIPAPEASGEADVEEPGEAGAEEHVSPVELALPLPLWAFPEPAATETPAADTTPAAGTVEETSAVEETGALDAGEAAQADPQIAAPAVEAAPPGPATEADVDAAAGLAPPVETAAPPGAGQAAAAAPEIEAAPGVDPLQAAPAGRKAGAVEAAPARPRSATRKAALKPRAPIVVPTVRLQATVGDRTFECAIQGGSGIIGRRDVTTRTTPEVDLWPDQAVSRRHLRIFVRGGRCYATELNTVNGTLLNGQPMERGADIELHPGDELLLGDHSEIRVLGLELPFR